MFQSRNFYKISTIFWLGLFSMFLSSIFSVVIIQRVLKIYNMVSYIKQMALKSE